MMNIVSSGILEGLMINEALKATKSKDYNTKFGTFIITTYEGKERHMDNFTGKKNWVQVRRTSGYFLDFKYAVKFFLYIDGNDKYVSSSQGNDSYEWVESLGLKSYSKALDLVESEVVKCFRDYYKDPSIY